MVSEELWDKLFLTEAPEVPIQAMEIFIEECKKDPLVEKELLSELDSAIRNDWAAEHEFFWIMIILGQARSEKAIPLLLRVFQLEEEDLLHECAQQALVWIGKEAACAVMQWLSQEPPSDEKWWGFSVLEQTLDHGDPSFINEVKYYLMKRVLIEEKKKNHEHLIGEALGTLAWFDGADVKKFIQKKVSQYEWNAELNEALEIAERQFPYPRDSIYFDDWREVAQKYANGLVPEDEEKIVEDFLEDFSEDIGQVADEHIKKEEWEEAEKVLIQLKKKDRNHWDGPERLARFYQQQGKIILATAEIQEALRRIHCQWKESPENLDYEFVEELEQLADEILSRDKHFPLRRMCDYLFGTLYDLGAIEFKAVLKSLAELFSLPKTVSEEEIFRAVKEDSRFQTWEEYIALKEIKDPKQLIAERDRRQLAPFFRYNLSGIKHFQEGRGDKVYISWEDEADEEIRDLTQEKWNLQRVKQTIRQDITRNEQTTRMLTLMSNETFDFSKLVMITKNLWNRIPRWELGGRTPMEAAEEHPEKFSPHLQVTKITRPGRNDLCPCGSNKKYKKCCLV